ncbi:outer membrane lipoprotein carrier protein LolA [Shimia thalassica]|jgi:outer membrane lipoprotein-sorting protein|uniref:Outer-membrane lipoprotein carrier protein n=1 Tax=Shimia thalassica TaxID=1715693 RepID=A0A0P1HZZ9_9RHOB|nr:outer membrane lipoprotein carrier protein LolA [Shimia thalassica]PHO05023.1 outer membrane lipoprotein carrier protein LolA [Rhodobacteraceae bacterium 4F10]MBU2941170.1 outer membrane lipoprotein carrier protein LolA [Shimia thalassica]MDO6480496.1 outer membrane lipoprotein carrier protein LolA [Shimia thalassica]MDO6483850.1 outer membrane lipoprotein carrier protein LolA [Shimia thalassica]MDO6503345.1 outer membrane lipoprotein carrier protein LolA [Shimia thalassica]
MTILRFLAVPALILATAVPAYAEKLSLNDLSKYLNRMKTAEARFTQINDDGSISTGTLFLKRPGKARFEYNPPEKALVLVSANNVAIFDGRSNQPPEQYPLHRTPLSVILARNVDLSRANMVVGHDYDGTATIVTAQDPEHPEYGNIQLRFTDSPVELRQWIINDGNGGRTTVVLGDTQVGIPIKNKIFNIEMYLRGH